MGRALTIRRIALRLMDNQAPRAVKAGDQRGGDAPAQFVQDLDGAQLAGLVGGHLDVGGEHLQFEGGLQT